MKILFISHTYPPIVGGVETQNFELYTWLSKIADVDLIANTHGRIFLPIFAPLALIKTLFLLSKYDAIVLGSGMVAIVGWVIKIFSSKPVISVVHGLDINYNSSSLGVWYEKFLIFIYQSFWTKIFIPKLDLLIAVGNETIRIGVKHGIPSTKFTFIPNGVDTEKNLVSASRQDLEKILGINIDGKKVILTSGRLAKRKGVAWFVENVIPKLPENVMYVVAGNGPDKENIFNAIKKTGLDSKVKMLGYVSDEHRNILFNTCDLFIQPNIKVEGDVEGFGISVIEAGACRLPVISSRLEGLQDAIKDGQNGFLVEPYDAEEYTEKITALLANDSARKEFGEKARQFIIENYRWEKIADKYLEEIKKVISKSKI
jgi:phosphatidylinositol alpha-1,6-mannosyltransferase